MHIPKCHLKPKSYEGIAENKLLVKEMPRHQVHMMQAVKVIFCNVMECNETKPVL